ncbi:6923_t:CDS:2, partial [Paraglomus occultum]
LGGGTETRILKYTYGVGISDSGDLSRHRPRNIFKRLAQRGTEVLIDSKFGCELSYRNQAAQLNISIYTTCEDTAKYCDDPGVELFGQLLIELLNVPDANPGPARSVDFSLIFGKTGIRAQAKDKLTGNKSEALFALKL